MKDRAGKVLYIGRAINLRKRIDSHLLPMGDLRHEQLKEKTVRIETITTDSVIEALILEANLVKKLKPKYNVQLKDDKSFLYVCISPDTFPRIYPCRPRSEKQPKGTKIFGPYTSATSLRRALDIIRKIFSYCDCTKTKFSRLSQQNRPCFWFSIRRCPGPAFGAISVTDYRRIIKHIKWFLMGRKEKIITEIKSEMERLSIKKEFEKAARLRDQIKNLQHIQDVAMIIEPEKVREKIGFKIRRIEGYDISNLFGKFAVGSMVTFVNNKPEKNWYRRFKIKTVKKINDLAMIQEVIHRRLSHIEWPKPDLIVIDGGKSHLTIVKRVLKEERIEIPVIALAKGRGRKKEKIFGDNVIDLTIVKQVRDEAHRFAQKYYRFRHRRGLIRDGS